jgi:signal transduction histidine kinase
MPRSSRRGAVFAAGDVARVRDGRTTGWSDAAALASGDNEEMDVRGLALGAVLGLLAIVELAARLAAGLTVRAGVGVAPVTTQVGVSASAALLMCALCLMATVPAAVFRPLPAAAAVFAATVLSMVLFDLMTAAGAVALLVVAYRLGRGGSRVFALALAAPFVGIALAAAVSGAAGVAPAAGLAVARGETRVLAVLLASLIPVAALTGMALRAREENRTHRAVRELTEGVLAEHFARGERARIARELHDVVAHHISMIAVQAETARLTTPGLTDAGAQRFAAIGDTARAGLTEMRRLLGVLREDAQAAGDAATIPAGEAAGPPPADRRPQPGLQQLAALVDDAREASGCAARLIVSGQVARLDPGVELAAYRIVQEALTNARRHAPGAAVDVELRYNDDVLRLHIRDNGPGCSRQNAVTGPAGHGLLGMRERAAAAGGSLQVGNAAGGGFCVGAELPAKTADGMTGAA